MIFLCSEKLGTCLNQKTMQNLVSHSYAHEQMHTSEIYSHSQLQT